MRTTPCPYCNRPAVLATRTSRYRRGDRVLAVEAKNWECASGCAGPNGEQPFRFEDPLLMVENDRVARGAWLDRFHEEMPPTGRPGRKTEEPRNVRVQVLFTSSEEEAIDAVRGDLPRSEFLRREVLRGLRKRKQAQAG